MKKILVPIDGSDEATKALNYALDLADKVDAAIEIFNVITEPTLLLGVASVEMGGTAFCRFSRI